MVFAIKDQLGDGVCRPGDPETPTMTLLPDGVVGCGSNTGSVSPSAGLTVHTAEPAGAALTANLIVSSSRKTGPPTTSGLVSSFGSRFRCVTCVHSPVSRSRVTI